MQALHSQAFGLRPRGLGFDLRPVVSGLWVQAKGFRHMDSVRWVQARAYRRPIFKTQCDFFIEQLTKKNQQH